jgi:hypothetical protein
MAYFEDLSDYRYRHFHRPGTGNIGWLSAAHEFPKVSPRAEDLDLVWAYCRVSVAQSRGFHDCELCPPDTSNYVRRKGEPLLFGTAEIRVFGREGKIYAAPTLIYHYISVHQYKPPDEFLSALREGPIPPSEEYFNRLRELDLKWRATSSPAERPLRIRPFS